MKFWIKKVLLAPLVGLSGVLFMAAAGAATQRIDAVFQPSPSHPMRNEFVNTTPNSGYCAIYPGVCQSFGMFSIRLPIRFTSSRAIEANHANERDGAMFKVPANWRELTVTHAATGEVQTLKLRIHGLGSTYRFNQPVNELVENTPGNGHYLLWGGASWVYPPPACLYSGLAAYTAYTYMFFWRTPAEAVCAKRASYRIPFMTYDYLDMAYQLQTPDPLKMLSGMYTGSLTYTLGPNQDFDMGDVMIPDDGALTLNFVLAVQHTLKVDIPPGGNKVDLVPLGGWQGWLNSGRKPARLFRDQTFVISTTSRFKMQMQCQYPVGDTCGLQDRLGNQVPLHVQVSLPNGLVGSSGEAVTRRPLLLSGAGTELLQPSRYVDFKPGTLHFEIRQADVEQMLTREAGTYKGNVTVVWDSQI